MSGKSYLLKKILEHRILLITPAPEKIIYCYKAWQPGFDNLKNQIPSIQFYEGIIDLDTLDINFTNIIVFDDLMTECLKNESVMNLFTVGSHHYNIGVFFITQNIFSKGKFARDISLNTNYMIIFHNPRDQQQFQILARQMYPQNSKYLQESFEDATKKSYGYLFLDLKQITEMKNRIQTGILPDELRIIYTIKNNVIE